MIPVRDQARRARRAAWRRIPSALLYRLPTAVAVAIIRRQERGRFGVSDVRVIDGPGGFVVHAYSGPPDVVGGPAVSVYLDGGEVLRIDLGSEPHIHYRPVEAAALGPVLPRVLIGATDRASAIDRAVFEVQHNLAYCLQTDARRRVRASASTDFDFTDVAARLRHELRDLFEQADRPSTT